MKSIFKSFKESISYKVLLLVITDLIAPTIISIINNDNKYIMLIILISFVLKILSL